MRWFAKDQGYGEEADFWAAVGLLHDIDFERYPEEHCKKAPELLEEAGAEPELIRAVVSHGWGICSDVEPEHPMEKILFAADELTGLIGAAAKMRPSGSVMDMEVKSLKKKFKDKRFAAGCSREVIAAGGGEAWVEPGGTDGEKYSGHALLRSRCPGEDGGPGTGGLKKYELRGV